MAQFGGYQRTFLVPKQQVLEALAAAQAAPPVQQEIGRKQRLRTLRAAEPISTVPSPLPSVRLPGWPAARHLLFLTPTTELGASELRIRYTDRNHLLTQLALLARANHSSVRASEVFVN